MFLVPAGGRAANGPAAPNAAVYQCRSKDKDRHGQKAALESGNRLSTLLQTYSQAFFVQTAQNAACNTLHSVSNRGARWLLATHDRAQGDSFHLTQEFLAFMLGVARQSVGIAVGDLQTRGLIEYHRGEMHILDRPGLESASCECYEIVRAEFSRLLGIARA